MCLFPRGSWLVEGTAVGYWIGESCEGAGRVSCNEGEKLATTYAFLRLITLVRTLWLIWQNTCSLLLLCLLPPPPAVYGRV